MDEILSKGRFLARATSDRSFGYSRTEQDKPTLGVRLTLLSGPNAGQTCVWWANFTDKSWQRSVESLRLLGWSTNDIRSLKLDPRREVEVTIEHENDREGRLRARPSWINAVEVTTDRPLEGRQLDEFSRWLADTMHDNGLALYEREPGAEG